VEPAGDFQAYPAASELIALQDDERPRFWVTIDTEEDFDWAAPFARTGFRLDSVPALAECQGFFERAGIVQGRFRRSTTRVAPLSACRRDEGGRCVKSGMPRRTTLPPSLAGSIRSSRMSAAIDTRSSSERSVNWRVLAISVPSAYRSRTLTQAGRVAPECISPKMPSRVSSTLSMASANRRSFARVVRPSQTTSPTYSVLRSSGIHTPVHSPRSWRPMASISRPRK